MAIDKSLYEAPQGLAAMPPQPDLSIEIEDPEAVRIGVDGMEIELEPGKQTAEDFNANLAEFISESTLQSLSSELVADYEADMNSRRDWIDTYAKGIELLGLKYEERTEPWAGACGVTHPLLMEAAVKFQSETIMETFPASGPVKTVIIGKETPEKKDASVRVAADMNFRLTEEMLEYRPEHERLLISLCLAGNAFKKIYFDPALGRQTAVFIPVEDIVVPYGATSLENAERVTHRMRKTKNELRRLQVAGFYRDIELGEPMRVIDELEKAKHKDAGLSAITDNRFQILEMHVDLDLEGYEDTDAHGEVTGIALPYIVTIEKGTSEILAIRRNWLEDDKLKLKRQHFVHYPYVPGFGFYAFGLIHLIGGHTKAATSLVRQLVDAGTLANLPGGLKSKGLRVKGDDTPIAPGEFRDVDLPSGAIRDNILPLPYKEPSATLVTLMDKIVDDARGMASTADLNVSDMSGQAPVGTTLAILERTLKTMSAVQARIHYAMKQEFKLLAGIIRDNTPQSYSYEPEIGEAAAKQSDYDMVDVIPVSDPNASTMAQRVVQYQAVFQMAQAAPQLYDQAYLHRQMLNVLGIKDAAKIVPMEDDLQPTDPVTENMNILMGKPVKAFLHQDHEAHITVHMLAAQDPKMAQMVGQNPQAQSIQAAGMTHIMEHLAFGYRMQIEQQLGALLPPMEGEESTLTPQMEVQVSQLAAQAALKLFQKNSAEAAQAQAQQQAQDPLVLMQMKDLEIKEAEVKRKAQKDLLDATAKSDELELKQAELLMKTQSAEAQMAMDMVAQDMQMQAQDSNEQAQLAMDVIRMMGEQANAQQASQNQMTQHQNEMEARVQDRLSKQPPKVAAQPMNPPNEGAPE